MSFFNLISQVIKLMTGVIESLINRQPPLPNKSEVAQSELRMGKIMLEKIEDM